MPNILNILSSYLGLDKAKSAPIIVLGMHRSGTSCLTGLLEEAGVYLGSVSKKNPFNLKGNHENNEIVNLNDEVMKFSKGNWHNPPEKLVWNEEHSEKRDIIVNKFEETDCHYWGFKDPRVVCMLPFWLEKIENPHFIGTFRHPLSVALSLHKRNNNFAIEYGLEIWKSYNLKLIDLYETGEFPLVCFDVEPDQYLKSVQSGLTHLGISSDHVSKMDFFDDSLRRNRNIDLSYDIPSDVVDVYERLVSLYDEKNIF